MFNEISSKFEYYMATNTEMFLLVAFILGLILTEVIYFIFVKTQKIEYRESYGSYTFKYKICSMFLSCFGLIILFFLIVYLEFIILFVGGVGLIFGYFYLNNLLTKRYAKKETQKEALEREKEDYNYKFKIGEKVRCIDAVSRSYRTYHEKELEGKIVTITDKFQQEGSNCYSIKESKHPTWAEDRFIKLKKKPKRRKHK